MRPVLTFLSVTFLLLSVAVAVAAADTHVWTDGNTNGDFNDAGNWDPAAVPATGDSVIIDYGSRSIDTNVDQSAKDFIIFTVGPNFTGGLGAGESTRMQFDATKLIIAGGKSGELWLEDGAAASWDTVVVSLPNSNYKVYLDGAAGTTYVSKGHVVLEGTGTDLLLDGDGGTANSVTVDLNASYNSVYVMHGDVNQTGGTSTTVWLDDGVFDVTGGTNTNLYQWGGSFYYSTSTDMAIARVFGGTLDTMRTAAARTIGDLAIYTGGYVHRRPAGPVELTEATVWGGRLSR